MKMARVRQGKATFRSKASDASLDGVIKALLQDVTKETTAGNHAKAVALLVGHLDKHPQSSDAWTALGTTLKKQGNLSGATDIYRSAITLHPKVAANYFGLAEVLRRRGELEEALDVCNTGLCVNDAAGEGHIIRSAILKDLGQAEAAIADLRFVIAANPLATPIHALLSDMFCGFERFDEALDVLNDAIAANPEDASLYKRQYLIFSTLRRTEEAIKAWEFIATLRADDAEAYRSLAKLYQEEGRTREAFDTFQKALEIDPKYTQAYTDLGKLVIADQRFDVATTIFRTVLLLAPDNVLSHHNLGVVLRLQNLFEEAVTRFRRALELSPNYAPSRVELCHIRQHFCDWEGLTEEHRALFESTCGKGKPVPPFAIIVSPRSSREDQLICARLWATGKLRLASAVIYPARKRDPSRERIRIGYVSTDLHTHATAMLVVELLERHDKTRFEVFAYSFGPDDGSILRRRIVAACDTFNEFRGLASSEATRRIHADDIDILIDLKGYTQDARSEIFASRPARIHVNYLGYPGTMGADFIDYIIADEIVAPMEHAASYDEKIVHLPNCYQPNDRKRAVAAHRPTRAECHLPSEGIVFCCFNNTYKINETVFGVWMRLLRAEPTSVLWLLEPNPVVAANLRREASARGVAPERIIFAPRLPADQHLARLAIADLFLDTLPVNAHTTASEALWVGLPVLTCLGDTFIGRVAASLVRAVGLPELITSSLDDYLDKAIQLARDPTALPRLRAILSESRLASPLFDTPRYTRNFEAALIQMIERHDAGEPPAAFVVPDQGHDASSHP